MSNWTRRDILKAAGATGAAMLAPHLARGAAQPASGGKKPNIIFILADDYGIPGMACYGGIYKTPNLDALAAGGIRFEYGYAAPLCAPTRALCMFGRYGFRTGVRDNGTGAKATPQTEVCIAKVLKQAGYATAVAGKWRQLSHFTTREDGAAWGFDEFMIWGVGNKSTTDDRYWNPNYNHNGKSTTDAKGKYGPDLLHEFVVDFIRRHRNTPFFIYYPMPLIHGPILPTPDSDKNAPREQLYADNIAYMDKLVGKLVSALDEMKLRENTLIVFIGDNGSVGQHTINGRPVDGAKGSMKEGGSRVPLIANWPGTTPAGVVNTDFIGCADFFPTFAELAGAQLPEGVKIDGQSFAAPLKGQKANYRDYIFILLGNQWYVRDRKWKLNQSGQLFDMSDAPHGEKLVPVEGQSAEAAAARKRLQAILDEINPGTAAVDAARAQKRLERKAENKAKADSPKTGKRAAKKAAGK
ncbi:MAG: sulfatase-like hydrolase/transferase [Candidatus Sumerlaeia bacterium]|nr:sulfatase-like hydrolase/transferase [Candidatus Sumerlaeia bacterium]